MRRSISLNNNYATHAGRDNSAGEYLPRPGTVGYGVRQPHLTRFAAAAANYESQIRRLPATPTITEAALT
ncbi:unnamed protein product [Merluccius merluccius]